MTDAATIIAEYERQERAAGGLANAHLMNVLEDTAKACGVSVRDAKRVLIAHWSMEGGG